MQELWKDIDGYVGLYQISNLGRVKSCDRYIYAGTGNNHEFQHLTERILSSNNGNYSTVILSKCGKQKCFTVHRLVAQAFIPNPNNLPCINHKDENKLNNCVDNLEWCTYKYNNEYNNRVEKCRDKISRSLKGKKRNVMLTNEQRKNISNAAKKGWLKRKSAIVEKEGLADEDIE